MMDLPTWLLCLHSHGLFHCPQLGSKIHLLVKVLSSGDLWLLMMEPFTARRQVAHTQRPVNEWHWLSLRSAVIKVPYLSRLGMYLSLQYVCSIDSAFCFISLPAVLKCTIKIRWMCKDVSMIHPRVWSWMLLMLGLSSTQSSGIWRELRVEPLLLHKESVQAV